MKKSVFGLGALIVLALTVLMGANTQNRLGPGYMNAEHQTVADADTSKITVYYFHNDSSGAFVDSVSTAAKRTRPRWWSFAAQGGVAVIHVFTSAKPGFSGDYTDTSSTNYLIVNLVAGQAWNNEGVDVHGWRYYAGATGASLQVIARH